jgi:hypothetical protein
MARPRGNRKTARLSVSLDAQDYGVLCEIARSQDVSVAWVVRRAVGDLVRGHQAGSEQPELPLHRSGAPTPKVGSR